MRTLVALKWVALRPEVDPLTGIDHPDPRFSGAGPADTSALEWALQLRDALGGTVTAVTVGPAAAETLLRQALAVGADHAVRVDLSSDHHAGADPAAPSSRWVAAELAAVAAGSDLVVCGYASPDRGSGAVPAFLAHHLGWPQALGLTGLATETTPGGPDHNGGPHRLVLERRLDGGRRERLALVPPGVLSLEPGPELRRAPLAATLTAGSALIDVRPARHVPAPAPAVLARRPFRPRARVVPAPGGDTRGRVVHLLGADQIGAHTGGDSQGGGEVSPADAARLVLERLAAWGYLPEKP